MVSPTAILLHRECKGNPGKCAWSRCQVLHKARCSLVHSIVDSSGPVIGELRAADIVKKGALTLLKTFSDFAIDGLEILWRVRYQRGAKLLKQWHCFSAGGQQVQHRIGFHGFALSERNLETAKIIHRSEINPSVAWGAANISAMFKDA